MINWISRRLLAVRYSYPNPIDRQRARVLLIINSAIALAQLAWLLISVIPASMQTGQVPLQSGLALTLTLGLNVVIYSQIQRGGLRWATRLFVGILLVNVIVLTIFWEPETPYSLSSPSIVALMVPLVAAGVLLDRRGMMVVTLILALAIGYAAYSQSQNQQDVVFAPSQSLVADGSIVVITMGLVLTFLLVFAGNLDRIAQESLTDVRQRQWITEFGIELGALDDETPIIARALDVVRDRFQHIFAQVYLMDEDGHFNRSMRSGMTQVEALPREALGMGDTSALNEAARMRQPILTSSDEPLNRRAHMIDAANFALAVPISHNNQVIGVLDVQSAGQNAFSQNEIAALRLMADQLGNALSHAYTVSDLQRTLREQAAFSGRLQSQITEYQQRERRTVSGAWGRYLEGRGKVAIGYNIERDNSPTPIPADDLPESLYATLAQGTLQVETVGDEQVINVPITFRDQTLGAMSFAVSRDQNLSERQIEMAEIVAGRLALALENTRLFEQSQAQATRERKASEISSALIGATDVRSVLDLAAESFNEALGAIHTRIYIQPGMLTEPLVEEAAPRQEEEVS